MWAALKALIQQEGTCVPSQRTPRSNEEHSQNKARFTLDPHVDKILKESESQRAEPEKYLGGMFWHHGSENAKQPLPHVSSPAVSPCKEDDRAPRIEAQAWRIRAAQPKALHVWEVRSLQFYEPEKEVSANSSLEFMHCSGSASDASWGQIPGWEVTHAFGGVHTDGRGHGWGGRPDKTREIWLGAEWGTPLQVERVKILQGQNRGHSFRSRNGGATTAKSVFIEAQLEDGSWGLIAGPVPINEDGWTTIRLCCAGAKRRRSTSDQEGLVPTPALRVASPNQPVPIEDTPPSRTRSARAPTSRGKKSKKVTFDSNKNLEAFPSLGIEVHRF